MTSIKASAVCLFILIQPLAASAQETCTSYLMGMRNQMLDLASQSLQMASDMRSAQSDINTVRSGGKVLGLNDCSRPISVPGQADAFRESARTYLCAAQTYNCALNMTNESSSVSECGAATNQCKMSDPIPH